MEGMREQLNRLYRPLDERAHEYIAEMTKLHGGFKIQSGFYNESGESVLKLLRKIQKHGFYY